MQDATPLHQLANSTLRQDLANHREAERDWESISPKRLNHRLIDDKFITLRHRDCSKDRLVLRFTDAGWSCTDFRTWQSAPSISLTVSLSAAFVVTHCELHFRVCHALCIRNDGELTSLLTVIGNGNLYASSAATLGHCWLPEDGEEDSDGYTPGYPREEVIRNLASVGFFDDDAWLDLARVESCIQALEQ